MKKLTKPFATALFTLALPSALFAASSDYSLFNPTPGDQLRPLPSSVYDGVLDARTIGAGHVSVESELVNYYANSSTPPHYSTHEFLWEPRIWLGLLDNVDLFVRPTYEIRSFDYRGDLDRFGNVNTGVKINLWGNDEGTTALALKPYISIPVHGAGILGGADLALLVRLPQDFYFKFDSEIFATENVQAVHYTGFENSMSLNKPLNENVEAYVYVDSEVTTIPNIPYAAYTGGGLKYSFTPDAQLFAGMGFGIGHNSFDFDPRLGFVARF